jgi:hypothetical protein
MDTARTTTMGCSSLLSGVLRSDEKETIHMQRSIAGIAAALLCTSWAISARPAVAQQQPPTQQEPPATLSPAPNISGQQLDKAAAAIKNLEGLRSAYTQKLEGAKPEEQDKIASEASAAMKKAVTDQGLSVEEYNSIVQLAQNDPTVRAQIEQRLGLPGN